MLFDLMRRVGAKGVEALEDKRRRATAKAIESLAKEAERVTSGMYREMDAELEERRRTIAFLRAKGHEDLARAIAHEEHWRPVAPTEGKAIE